MENSIVLFVDDDINILNSIKRSITDESFEALFATDPNKALEIVKMRKISVVVSDMKMPGISGLELLKLIKEISPTTVRVVLSGFAHLPQILATVNSVGVFRYITKPWDDDEDFLPAIRDSIDFYKLNYESETLREKLIQKNKLFETVNKKNEELIYNIKHESQGIKSIGYYFMKMYIAISEGKFSPDLDVFSLVRIKKNLADLYFDYSNLVPIKKENFLLGKLKEEVETTLKNAESVSFNIDEDEFINNGEYTFFKFIISKTLNFIIEKYNFTTLDVIVKSNPTLTVIVENKNFDFKTESEVDKELSIFLNLVNQMLVTINGKIVVGNISNDNITIFLKA